MRDYSAAIERNRRVHEAVVRWRPVATFGIVVFGVLLGAAMGNGLLTCMAVAGIPAGIMTGRVLRQTLPGGNGTVSRLSDAWRVRWWVLLVGVLSVGTLISAWGWWSWAWWAWPTSVLAILLLVTELMLGSRLAARDEAEAPRHDQDLAER